MGKSLSQISDELNQRAYDYRHDLTEDQTTGLDYIAYRRGSGNSVEIYDIAVNSERGIGRGRSLLDTLLLQIGDKDAPEWVRQCKLIYALTRASNKEAHKFYIAVGFRQMGRLDMFYADTPEDAIMFGLDVD